MGYALSSQHLNNVAARNLRRGAGWQLSSRLAVRHFHEKLPLHVQQSQLH